MSAATPVYVAREVAVPVYHLPGGARRADGNVRTLYGLVIYEWVAPTHIRDRMIRLRLDWARKIGVPCIRCLASRK